MVSCLVERDECSTSQPICLLPLRVEASNILSFILVATSLGSLISKMSSVACRTPAHQHPTRLPGADGDGADNSLLRKIKVHYQLPNIGKRGQRELTHLDTNDYRCSGGICRTSWPSGTACPNSRLAQATEVAGRYVLRQHCPPLAIIMQLTHLQNPLLPLP